MKKRSVCAWCGREMFHDKLSGTTSMGNLVQNHKDPNSNVRHGICKDCAKEQLKNHQPKTYENFNNWLERKQKS